MFVKVANTLELISDGVDLPVMQDLNCAKVQVARRCDEERNFVDKHDVDAYGDATMYLHDVPRHAVHSCLHMRGSSCRRLAFEGSKARSKDVVCCLYVRWRDWAIPHVFDGHIHHLSNSWPHHNVL